MSVSTLEPNPECADLHDKINSLQTHHRAIRSMCPDLIAYAVLEIRGEVPEWSNGAVSKTVVPQGTVGSNPTLSAITFNDLPLVVVSLLPSARALRFGI